MKLNMKLIIQEKELVINEIEDSYPLKNIIQSLIKNKELSIKINRKDRIIFIRAILNYFTKIAKYNKAFKIKITTKKAKNLFSFNKKIMPFSKTKLVEGIKYFEFNETVGIKPGEVFYDCNYPEKREGFKIIELSEDIYKYEALTENLPDIK